MAEGGSHFRKLATPAFVIGDSLTEDPPDQDRRGHRSQYETGPDPSHAGVEPAHANPGQEDGKPHRRRSDDERCARVATSPEAAATDEPDRPERQSNAERV